MNDPIDLEMTQFFEIKRLKVRIAELENRLRIADKAYQALFDECGGWIGIIEKNKRLKQLENDLDDLQATFDLQQTRMTQAIKAWRDANPGNELVKPDLGKLLEWLLTDKNENTSVS